MLFLVASAAIILPLLLLVVLRMPAKYGMTISASIVAALALTVWAVPDIVAAASALQGVHRAVSILWILFGAIVLLKVLLYSGAMHRIKAGFGTISLDMRVQAVLIGVAFVALLEGLTGFGAPITIAAPLLVALGFRPIAAVIIGLIGDSVPVVFGAAGTPVIIGLSNVPGYTDPAFASDITRMVTMIDFVVALLLPLIVVTVVVKVFGENKHARSSAEIREVAPWALMIGLVYATTAVAATFVFSAELISIVAGLVTLVVATITAHRNVLLHPDLAWRTHEEDTLDEHEVIRDMSLTRAWLPYILVILALAVTRLVPWVNDVVRQYADASWTSILGVSEISSTWELLYSPGTIMAVVAILIALSYRLRSGDVVRAGRETGGIVLTATAALLPALVMLQIFANSGINDSGFLSMPAYIATGLANIFGGVWVVVAPVLGALGAFIAGSSTVSALTMAEIQYAVAQTSGMSTTLVLAQQLSGSGAGNMIAVHNIVAASAVVGIYHQEGNIIRRLLPVVAVYILLSLAGVALVALFGLV